MAETAQGEGARELGNKAFKNGDLKEAISCYRLCPPDDASALSNMSLCLLRLGDGNGALSAANRCTELRPEWAKAWGRKGAALRLLGDHEGALEAVDRALKEEPGNKEMLKERRDLLKTKADEGNDGSGMAVGRHMGSRGITFPPGAVYTLDDGPKGGARNLLVLLHGLGDSDTNFIEFGRRLALPDTAILAIRAPLPLPLGLGHAWVPSFEEDGEMIKPSRGERRRIIGLEKASEGVIAVLEACWRAGYERDRSFLVGFSQGGLVAVDAGAKAKVGGVVGMSGSTLPEAEVDKDVGSVPMLITHGIMDNVVEARECFGRLKGECVRWKEYKKGLETPKTEAEVRDLMEFMAPLMSGAASGAGGMEAYGPDVVEVKDPSVIRQVLSGMAGKISGT